MSETFASNEIINTAIHWLLFAVLTIVLPFLTVGTIRKTRARMQRRVGAPFFQLYYDVKKLFKKSEVVSSSASWIFRSGAGIELVITLICAAMLPWISGKPTNFSSDLFLVTYLMASDRLFTILPALDSGSPFGAFGGSRAATLAMLAEPASLLGLVSLAIVSQSSDLNVIFALTNESAINAAALWLLGGTVIVLASLVELSRIPIDDPTTHLELTMIHEATILENSGRNLALREYSKGVKMAMLFGLAAQCYLRVWSEFWVLPEVVQVLLSVAGIIVISFCVGVFESLSVRLQWRKVPEFISYCMTISLLASLVAVARETFH